MMSMKSDTPKRPRPTTTKPITAPPVKATRRVRLSSRVKRTRRTQNMKATKMASQKYSSAKKALGAILHLLRDVVHLLANLDLHRGSQRRGLITLLWCLWSDWVSVQHEVERSAENERDK